MSNRSRAFAAGFAIDRETVRQSAQRQLQMALALGAVALAAITVVAVKPAPTNFANSERPALVVASH